MSNIKQLRIDAGWTQADVAAHAQVDVRTVKRWESEARPPRRVELLYASLFNENATDDNQQRGQRTDAGQPIPLSEVVQIRPEPLELRGRLAPLLGSIPSGRAFSILLSGAAGAGKSSVAMMIASMLSEHGPVLYATAEERLDSGTIGIRAEHVGVEEADIDVAEVKTIGDVDEHLTDAVYEFCVIDSINEIGIEPTSMINLMSDHRTVSWILIAQADATEKASIGGARWRHLVDIRLWCERQANGARVIRNLKNRFAPQVDELMLSAPSRSSQTLRGRKEQSNIHKQPKDVMVEHDNWYLAHLQAEIVSLKRQLERAQEQLSERDLELRKAEQRLTRYEVRDEMSAESEPRGLADKLNMDTLSTIADKLQPFAPMIGDIVKGLFARSTANDNTLSPFATTAQHSAQPVQPKTQVHNTNPFAFDDSQTERGNANVAHNQGHT